MVFFFKQKTAYEMRISDWSSDVCSSDLGFVERIIRLAIAVNVALDHPQHRIERRAQFFGAARRNHFQGALDQQGVAEVFAQALQHSAGGRLCTTQDRKSVV